MSEKEYQFVFAIFDGQKEAEEIIEQLKKNQKEMLGELQALVAMSKDAHGRISYKDVGMTPAKGALGGVVLGAVVGIASGGGTVLLGALGSVVGGLVGKRKSENRISSEQINKAVASILPDSSAILAVVCQDFAPKILDALRATDAEIFIADLPVDLAGKLSEHHDIAYSALMKELV